MFWYSSWKSIKQLWCALTSVIQTHDHDNKWQMNNCEERKSDRWRKERDGGRDGRDIALHRLEMAQVRGGKAARGTAPPVEKGARNVTNPCGLHRTLVLAGNLSWRRGTHPRRKHALTSRVLETGVADRTRHLPRHLPQPGDNAGQNVKHHVHICVGIVTSKGEAHRAGERRRDFRRRVRSGCASQRQQHMRRLQ